VRLEPEIVNDGCCYGSDIIGSWRLTSMSEHRERRRAKGLGDAPKRRPSLASPLPPSPIVPSTPLPRGNHQRPRTASSARSDPPSTRGLMKRLLAKPAPPSSPSAPSSPSMCPGFHHPNTAEDDYELERHITCSQDHPPSDAPPTPRSTNEFDKSIRALDLVGQIDISMSPYATAGLDFITEPLGFANKQRNLFRLRPSGSAVTTPPALSPGTPPLFLFFFLSAYPFLLEYPIGFRSIDDDSATATATATPTPSTTPPLLRFPRRSSSSSPTRHLTSKKLSACSGSSLGRPKASHNHPTNSNKVEQSQVTPYNYHNILGDNSTIVGAGGSGDLFWDACGEYKKGEQPREDDGAGSTPTLSGEWRKNDSDHQIRSKSSVQEFARSSVDKDLGMAKNSPDVPAGGSPSRRFWKLVKKFSVGGLREKNQADSDHLPPVPPLPSHCTNDPFHIPIDSSLVNNTVSLSALVSSPTLVDRSALVPSTPPSAQHRTKLSHSAHHSPPSQPTTGPRPSTTTRSSSPSSDVASSRFFNRQSARSSTSSLGEEAIPVPPLPESSISTATSKMNGKMNANDTNANLELQQHIIPPRKLSQNHSTSDLPCISPIAIVYPPPSMDDDWTIIRSPSVELEAVSLPPPPRQLLKGIGISVGHKAAGYQGNKAKAIASDMIPKMLKTVNISSEHVDEKSRDNAHSQENEENIIEEITTSERGDKEKDVSDPNTDRDSNRSQSPTIPSFSTSSAINSFPARRVSSSLSARSRSSPIALSPDRNPGSVFSAANGLRSPSRSPQRGVSHTAFGRVRQHLFGTNDVRVIKDEEVQEVLNPLLSSRKSDAHLYSSSSSGNTSITAKPRSTHTTASSVSMSASPTITYHRRSMSFNMSSPPTQGLFTTPNPFSDASRLSSADSTPHITPPPPPPVGPSLTSSMGHRTRTSSNLRSRFPSRKLSEVLFLSSSSSPARAPPSTSSSHRTIGSLNKSQSINIGASNNHSKSSNTSNPGIPASQSRAQLTDQEKTEKWNDLLARSARAGGTLHLAAGSRLLGSDETKLMTMADEDNNE
jgi:hypothetical protein